MKQTGDTVRLDSATPEPEGPDTPAVRIIKLEDERVFLFRYIRAHQRRREQEVAERDEYLRQLTQTRAELVKAHADLAEEKAKNADLERLCIASVRLKRRRHESAPPGQGAVYRLDAALNDALDAAVDAAIESGVIVASDTKQ